MNLLNSSFQKQYVNWNAAILQNSHFAVWFSNEEYAYMEGKCSDASINGNDMQKWIILEKFLPKMCLIIEISSKRLMYFHEYFLKLIVEVWWTDGWKNKKRWESKINGSFCPYL